MRVRFSLRPPNIMNLKKINNLVELFFEKYRSQKKEDILLTNLKDINKPYSWNKTIKSIINLSSEISKYIKKGDRCLLISENRPEWLIADLSIMLSNGITVPAYTTYICLLYTSPSPRDRTRSRMPSSA